MHVATQAILAASVLSLAIAAIGPSCAVAAEPSTRPATPVVVGYFAEWNDTYAASAIPADLVTHVNYSFARVKDGEIALGEPGKDATPGGPHPSVRHFAELRALKAKHPQLKTLISVGGWGAKGFSAAAADEAARTKFAKSCAAFAHANGLDGIDIDWEFPGEEHAEDGHRFTLLLAELRKQLDAQATLDGHPYLLTIAAPAGPQNYGVIELGEIGKSLDLINLMSYDLNGGWSAKTDFNAALFAPPARGGFEPNSTLSVDATVRAYLAAGVPKDKLVVGVPFYGRAWGGVPKANDGLFQPHDKSTPKPPDGGEWTYRSIAAQHFATDGRRHWDEAAKVPWLYDPQTNIMVSYDDPESIRAKGTYVRERGLAGAMIWELSQDDDQRSLLNALTAGLHGGDGK